MLRSWQFNSCFPIPIFAHPSERIENALTLAWTRAALVHVRTFRSETDGSVQYFGVIPPSEVSVDETRAF